MWDENQSHPDELVDWFFKHKLQWDNIVRVFTHWLIDAINTASLPYANAEVLTNKFYDEFFKEEPTASERSKILYQLSPKITTDSRDKVYAYNLKLIAAAQTDNKPIILSLVTIIWQA